MSIIFHFGWRISSDELLVLPLEDFGPWTGDEFIDPRGNQALINELISLKIRSLMSAIICDLRFSRSTLRFKAPSKSDWMNLSPQNVSTVAWLVSSIDWLDSTVPWLQSTEAVVQKCSDKEVFLEI